VRLHTRLLADFGRSRGCGTAISDWKLGQSEAAYPEMSRAKTDFVSLICLGSYLIIWMRSILKVIVSFGGDGP
jgi:hypothetical protein